MKSSIHYIFICIYIYICNFEMPEQILTAVEQHLLNCVQSLFQCAWIQKIRISKNMCHGGVHNWNCVCLAKPCFQMHGNFSAFLLLLLHTMSSCATKLHCIRFLKCPKAMQFLGNKSQCRSQSLLVQYFSG